MEAKGRRERTVDRGRARGESVRCKGRAYLVFDVEAGDVGPDVLVHRHCDSEGTCVGLSKRQHSEIGGDDRRG